MELDKLDERIRRDCQPYLALLHDGASPLYRGAPASAEVVSEWLVRRDRKPRSMPIELHEAADQWFSRNFGVRFRSAGFFCTGDPKQAEGFGAVYQVFPIGGFQFCWSPNVRDLHEFSAENDYLRRPSNELVEALDRLNYREEDFGKATASGCEIMIACGRYYALAVRASHARNGEAKSLEANQ